MKSQSIFARSWEVQLCLQPLNVGPLATLIISLSVVLLSGFWSRRIGWRFGGRYSQDNVRNFLYTVELHDTFNRRPQWPGHTKTEMLIDGIGARFPLFFRAATLYLPSFNLLRKVRAQITQVGRQVLREKIAAMKEGMDSGHDLYTKLCELSSRSCRVASLTMGHAGENTSSSKGKLTDEEITEQTSFLLFAGQETTVLGEFIYMYRSAHNILSHSGEHAGIWPDGTRSRPRVPEKTTRRGQRPPGQRCLRQPATLKCIYQGIEQSIRPGSKHNFHPGSTKDVPGRCDARTSCPEG